MVALALVFDHFSGYCMHKWWGLQLSLVGSIGLKKTVSHSCNPCWKTCLGSNDESRVPTIEYFPSKESRCNISVPSEKWLAEEPDFAKKCSGSSSNGMTGGCRPLLSNVNVGKNPMLAPLPQKQQQQQDSKNSFREKEIYCWHLITSNCVTNLLK